MTEKIIKAACNHWALEDSQVTLVGQRENRVYRIDTANGPVAMRLHRPGYRTIEEIHSEILWMDMLASHGMAVPRSIQAPDGAILKSLEGVVVDLLTWVAGTPLSTIETESSTDIFHELGHMLAMMHNHADRWDLPIGFSRPTWNLLGNAPSWGRFWENPMLTENQVKRFQEFQYFAKETLDKLKIKDVGLIHADLVPDNVLVSATTQTRPRLHLIDFDDGGFGYRLFDLATVTFKSRRKDMTGELAEATVDGYLAARENADEFLQESLGLFEAMRACSYVGWNIARIDEAEGVERNARFIAEAQSAIDLVF